MSDLLALVFEVRPPTPLTVPAHLGRAVYAQMLRWLAATDPQLTARWHDADGVKPYTCSGLVGGARTGKHERTLKPEATYWFRITALEPTVAAALLTLADTPPPTAELDGVTLDVTAVHARPTDHLWAGSSSYEALAGPYLLARERAPRDVGLRFVTPVSFKQAGVNQPLPLPDLVFGGLADRWNAFSSVAVSPGVRDYCAAGVTIKQFELASRGTPGKGSTQIGAVGTAHYGHTQFDQYWASVLALLGDFAFYAGVGRGTSTGMGQTQRHV